MKQGDLVRIRNTDAARQKCIAGMQGQIERVTELSLYIIVTDPYYGPAGPFILTEADVQLAESGLDEPIWTEA